MIRQSLCVFTIALLLGSATTSANAQDDWPQFRGQNGSAVSESALLPTVWSPNANLGWRTELPGPGASSPIVVGNKVFVTCYSGYGLDRANPGKIENLMRHLVCVDAKTGKKLWQKDVKAALPEDPFTGAGIPAHGYASHTPVSDGTNVYAFFGKSGVHAFDMDGKELWQADVGKESDPTKWGSSSSPIIHENSVIVTASAESQSIVGLDKETGEELWRQEAEMLDGMWGTPSLVKVDDSRTDLVLGVAKEMWGLDPSSGKMRWHATATESQHAYTSLVLEGKRAYAFMGRGGGSIAVDVGGEGDVTESNVVWTGKDTASFASPVKHGERLYLVAQNVLSWVDAKTGKRIDRVRLEGTKQSGGRSLDYASPIIAGNNLFYMNGGGQMFVFELGDEVKQIAVNQVTNEKEVFWGSPAISNNQMILRSDKYLYCVTDKGEMVSAEDLAAAKADETDEAPEAARGGGGRRGGGGGRDPMAMFNNIDTDKNGSISKEELDGNQMAERLMTLDKDGDKAISKDEFSNGIAGLFRSRGGGGGGGRGGRGNDTRPDRPERPESAGAKSGG